jgi:hypothetical protein
MVFLLFLYFCRRQFPHSRTAALCLKYKFLCLLLRGNESAAIFSLFRQSCQKPNPIAISSFVPLGFHASKFVAVLLLEDEFGAQLFDRTKGAS